MHTKEYYTAMKRKEQNLYVDIDLKKHDISWGKWVAECETHCENSFVNKISNKCEELTNNTLSLDHLDIPS